MRRVLSIEKPGNPLPVIFDSPHSGTEYPDDFRFACPYDALRKAEDTYVDELFAATPDHGAPFLKALFPRSYIDANRAATDIDPEILDGPWPADLYGPALPSPRSDAGIGLIRRLVKPGLPVYDRQLPPAEIMARIEKYHRPYHKALEELLNEAHYNYGQVWHIDCHSMPASAALPHRPHALYHGQPQRLDFVLGDCDGTTAGRSFVHAVRDFLRGLGYTVGINDPYKGAELVRRYAQPTRGRHSLQIEINKALYMDEDSLAKTDNFVALQSDLGKFIEFCAEYARQQCRSLAAD